MKLDCAACPVRDSAACAALTHEEREALARLGVSRSFARGETVFHAGDDNDKAATLTEGLLKVTQIDANGDERILSLVHPAGFAGEMFAPVLNHDVVALTDSRLCFFRTSDYEAAIEKYPALSTALLRRSAEDLYRARSQIALDGKKTASAKVANLIVGLSRAASHSPCHGAERFDLPLTRGEMGQLLGLTIETISRQIGRFEKDGVLTREKARGIRITDPARLTALAD